MQFSRAQKANVKKRILTLGTLCRRTAHSLALEEHDVRETVRELARLFANDERQIALFGGEFDKATLGGQQRAHRVGR